VGRRDGRSRLAVSRLFRRGAPGGAVEPFAPTRDDTILAAISHVVTACEQRTPFEMDAEEGYRAIELCAGWKESAATQQPVELPLPAGG
jgi:hypothetical protein